MFQAKSTKERVPTRVWLSKLCATYAGTLVMISLLMWRDMRRLFGVGGSIVGVAVVTLMVLASSIGGTAVGLTVAHYMKRSTTCRTKRTRR